MTKITGTTMILLALKLLWDQVYNYSHTAAVLKAKENRNKKESVCPQSAISLQLNAVKLEIKCNVCANLTNNCDKSSKTAKLLQST